MERHDPEEGPSVPRYVLGRGARGRLALVSDIETVEGDVYRATLRPTSSVISDDSSTYQYSPPVSPVGEPMGRSHSFSRASRSQLRRLETIPDPVVPDVDDDADTSGIGRISVAQPGDRHSTSAHTESSYGAIDLEGPRIIPGYASSSRSPSIPPPIPIKDQKRAVRDRPSSAQTASSYALYTPRTPGKQVRFSEEDLKKTATPGANDVPPLPPHALDELRATTQVKKPKTPHYFYGPPPLHGDDISPPTYDTKKAANADDDEGLSWSEKVGFFDPSDNDPTKPWYRRKKGYCFWIVFALAALTIVFGIIVGAVVGVKASQENKGDSWGVSNGTDFPPPGGFLGTWGFTTTLTNVSSGCAPPAESASSDLWRCFPFQNPPSTSPATWSFVISGDAGADSNTANVQQLMISSAGNPFALSFPPQQLNLTRYLTNAYYQFTMRYTKTSVLTINGRTASCEFPNSILTGTLYVNNTIFGEKNAPYATKPASQAEVRGEWPGDVIITEEKLGGGRQVVCRDRGTDDVIDLGDLTETNGLGNCLCNYQNFGVDD